VRKKQAVNVLPPTVSYVRAVRPGPGPQLVPHVLAGVVDAQLGAERGCQLGLGTGADGSGHPGPRQPGDLHRHVTDAARARLDQDRLAGADPGPSPQRLPGGDGDQRCRRGLGERQPFRLARQVALVHHLGLGVGARDRAEAAVAEVHLVSGPDPGHGRPRALHYPGAVPAENGGQHVPERAVLAELVVHRVDPGRPQPDQDIMVAVEPGVRNLGQLQDLWPADRRHQHRAHERSLRSGLPEPCLAMLPSVRR
jgi:hypothetical protein